ncbi:MAG: phosphoribosylformylglycinamidine synthase [Treponema sp.]|nr:phosphoribosylformylglycinamidine synthase [Treponema sp.]
MIRRIFIEKKRSVSKLADNLRLELNTQLNTNIDSIRCFLRYDIEGLNDDEFKAALSMVFSEPPVDDVFLEDLPDLAGYDVFAVEYLPGQYDLRADSAAQCVQLLTMGSRPLVRCATVYAMSGAQDIQKIQNYLVNPVDSRIASNEKPASLTQKVLAPEDVKEIEGFRSFARAKLQAFCGNYALAMSIDDLEFVRDYFAGEGREPTETEIRVLDTYWSDHCRHTTFLTELKEINFDTKIPEIEQAYNEYRQLFKKHYEGLAEPVVPAKYQCLMDMATIGVRELKSRGLLPALDESEEINACSIKVRAETNDGPKDYLVMFKNETHNHPTEIEPFGGAATCLGGAIRDPLSGRAYVYHSMRVSGAADICAAADKVMPGKLPQRVISKEAARGFSSYGNQIGLATGIVAEVYHPGYVAKRLEAGFIVGAAPAENVQRERPQPGDLVLLIGGETGRDGCGGATGSSKEHDAQSLETGGAEVQKGNPITERKIQRLFRNPDCARLIKRCNDFGAGGVCVAIGELADGLLIDLDAVPKKYAGLSGTELAISESQERMAVVISPENLGRMTELCAAENVRVTPVALVTDTERMIMNFGGREIVNLKRPLLSSNGVKQTASALIKDELPYYMDSSSAEAAHFLKEGDYAGALGAELKRLNVCSNKGMSEMFDSSIGAGTVFMPFGGVKQLTPILAMAAKLPVSGADMQPLETDTATVAAWGFDPYLMSQSPFTGAQYSVLLSVAKLCAAGAPFDGIYLTLQEYFKKLGSDPARWGQPVSAVLGALSAQLKLGLGAIGGKDSMSGSFMELDVPPTLISFAIAAAKASKLIGNVLYDGARVYRIVLPRSASGCPDFDFFVKLMKKLSASIADGKINFCTVVEAGGAAAAIAKSCLGNGLGFKFDYCGEDLFYPRLADILIAGASSAGVAELEEFSPEFIGEAGGEGFVFAEKTLSVQAAEEAYLETLAAVFPISADDARDAVSFDFHQKTYQAYGGEKFAAPRVLIPVFPGTNCEYDTAKKFLAAGAKTEMFVFKNLDAADIKASAASLASLIKDSQIIAIPGGFSGGDEPDGSSKFIATAFRSPQVADAVAELLEKRQGLILGICNGFQALIKLGLLPFGKIAPMSAYSATLYYNNIGRHVSALCPVRVASTDSPWLSNVKVGDIFMTAVSHGEGRLIAGEDVLSLLKDTGRICTQYVDDAGLPSAKIPHNPNGSVCAIEGLISPCGRILGKMGHVERAGEGLFKNVPGEKVMDLFSAGVSYFK